MKLVTQLRRSSKLCYYGAMTSRQSQESKRLGEKYRSTTHYVLSGLLPYTEANLKLSFSPNRFFNDLEKISNYKLKSTAVRTSYYRAVKRGLIELGADRVPRLTDKGLSQLSRYEPRKLKSADGVLVIFDIPEGERSLRNRLRALLRELRFIQVQKSVWRSDYDVVKYVVEWLREEGVDDYVQVYESIRVA